MAITEDEFKQLQANIARNKRDLPEWIPEEERTRTRPKPHQSSRKIPKTEQIYMRKLDLEKQTGVIIRYWHEPFKLILTHGVPGKVNEMSYKVDFLVQFPGHLRCVEIKANKKAEYEDSWVKLRTACEMFPCFEFVKVYINTKTGAMQEEILT